MFIGLAGNKIYKLLNMITRKVEKYGDADFDEYSFPYSQRELAIRLAAPTLQPTDVTSGLSGAPAARGPATQPVNPLQPSVSLLQPSRTALGATTLGLIGVPTSQPLGTTLGLSKALVAKGLSMHNSKRDCIIDANVC